MLTFTPSVKIVAHMMGNTLREVAKTSLSEVKMPMSKLRSK